MSAPPPHTPADVTRETDHYATLGVTRDASQDDIHRAYRRLVRELHPDTHPDASQDRMKEVTSAYAILGDPARRAEYDRTLPQPVGTPDPAILQAFLRPFAPSTSGSPRQPARRFRPARSGPVAGGRQL